MPRHDLVEKSLSKLAHLDLEDEVIQESPIMEFAGGFSDIFVGSLRRSKVRCAIKRMRTSLRANKRLIKVSVITESYPFQLLPMFLSLSFEK